MAKSVSTHQRGFTLIEMSIVLVIIGLIVGGILKGQELIESSRQKNLMSQIDRLKAGTTTFVDRYKALPGDFNRVAQLPQAGVVGTTGGNEDGIVGSSAPSTAAAIATLTNALTAGSENINYFNHLLASDLGSIGSVIPSGGTVSCFTGLCGTSSPLPTSAFPNSGLNIVYGSHEGSTANSGTATPKPAHWYVLSRFAAAALTAADSVLSPSRAFQIDNKYDDGQAGAGNIRSGYVGTGCGSTTADYTPAATGFSCVLLFSME